MMAPMKGWRCGAGSAAARLIFLSAHVGSHATLIGAHGLLLWFYRTYAPRLLSCEACAVVGSYATSFLPERSSSLSSEEGLNMALRTQKIERYGWIPDLPDHRDHLYAAPVVHLAKLPAKVDLRGKCPTVYDQGQLGSCTANAIGAAIQFDRMKQKRKPNFIPSRLFIYYNERVIEGTVRSDSGAQIRDGIKTVAHDGDCPEKEWPYDIAKFAVKPSAKCYKDALKYKAVRSEERRVGKERK